MNTLLVVLLGFATIISVQGASLEVAHANCQKNPTTHISDELHSKINQGIFEDNPPIVKIHLLCMSQGMDLQKANGDINVATIKSNLLAGRSQEDIDRIVNQCLVKKATPEVTALQMMKCLYENGARFH